MNSKYKGRPLPGVQYALTGKTGDKCIANGNTWDESRVDPKCRVCGLTHVVGTREATRDFVMSDICIGCNKAGVCNGCGYPKDRFGMCTAPLSNAD